MKTNIFTHEITESSSVFGRKHDISVAFGGDQPCTDGSTIYLPELASNQDMTEEQVRVTRGFVDHEAGHVRHTNFNVVKRANAEFRKTNNKLMPILVNALEDVRLERRVMEEYPGAKKNFTSMATAINKIYLDQYKEMMKTDPAAAQAKAGLKAWIGPFAITWAGRLDYGEDTSRECLETLPDPAFQEQCIEWAEEAARCKDTSAIVRLAKKIEPFLRDEEKDEPEGRDEPQGPVGEPCDDGEPGDTPEPQEPGDDDPKGDGEGEGEDEDDKPEVDGVPKGEGEDEGEDEGEGEGDGEGEDEGEDEDEKGQRRPDGDIETTPTRDETEVEVEPLDPDAAKGLETVLGQLTGSEGTYRPWTKGDKVHHRTDSPTKYCKHANVGADIMAQERWVDTYNRIVDECRGETSVMRRRLERTLLARQNRDWNPAQESGRLDSRRLGSVLTGNVHVFKTRTDMPDMDTAVSMLVDMSGSMFDSRIALAQQTAISLCQVMEKVGVAYELLGFNQLTTTPPSHKTKSHRFSRPKSLDHFIFKQFDESLRDARGPIGSMARLVYYVSRRQSGINNVDGEAVNWAWLRLLARREQRRILIVLSDGQPAFFCRYVRGPQGHLVETIETIRQHGGVELVGIGIQSDAVRHYYPRYVIVNNLSDLAGEAIDQLGQLLLNNDRYSSRVAV